jgi:cytidylate kinase
MTDLRAYMASDFVDENQIVEDLEETLAEVSETFCQTYDTTSKAWPYEIRSSIAANSARSQTTKAMILCAILAMRDEWSSRELQRASSAVLIWPDFPLPKALCADLAKEDKNLLQVAITALLREWSCGPRGVVTKSSTFGANDPMSLGWALDLLNWTRSETAATRKLEKRVIAMVVKRAKSLCKAADGRNHTNRTLCASLMETGDREVGDSTYLLTRFAMVLSAFQERSSEGRRLAGLRDVERAQGVLFDRFETHLHEQLSFAEITDSRFDATELIYCLEGMLLVRGSAVTRPLFDRVMGVLKDIQDKTGYWRSETPMLYQKKGDVLFTVSVEAANAVLASFSLFDQRWAPNASVASDHIDLLKRYWKWLKARKALVKVQNKSCVGWHSEHVNDPNLIHLWETSQVAEFLVNFRDQLKRHIARKSLRLAACLRKGPSCPKPVADIVYSDAGARWRAAATAFEPVTCLGLSYRIYDRVGASFVAPRVTRRSEAFFSMLLFGPPGTGKTTLASALSWSLGYPLITITVSDFLADGAAALEARAKDLFNMLRVQPRSVVLFDEIDQFLLDRDSEHFREQDSVFQFLTPGMLTKINELRASKSVIFVMATNYQERIDKAIKRRGRIDAHFLLLPPDKRRRTSMIKSIWAKGSIDVAKAAELSVFASYADLLSVHEEYDAGNAIDGIKKLSPAAIPQSYTSRFVFEGEKAKEKLKDPARAPLEEFTAMLLLQMNASGKNVSIKKTQEEALQIAAALVDNKSAIERELRKILEKSWPVNARAKQ